MNMSCLREVLDGQPARGAEPSQGGPQACDTLSDLLELVHIHGEAVLSCAPEPPFSLAFPATAPSMHTVARGMLTICVDGLKDPIQLGPGEVLLLPHGAAHVVASGEAGATIDVAEALRLRFDAERYSLGSGTSTAWFWGSFSFDSLISRRLLDALPIVITLRDLDELPLE